MSKVKKNVFQEFMQDDYVPQNEEYIVKYVAGKGNNLHEVEDVSGVHYLVTMPKKFRQTVWLKKNDCIVVNPITEGKKVRGEIICVIPVKNVVQMLESNEWRPKGDPELDKDSYIKFFQKHLQLREDTQQSNTSLTSSDDESSEEETGSEEAESGDEDFIGSDEERQLELEISSDNDNSDKHDSVASGS